MMCWLSFEDTEDGGVLIRPGLPEGEQWTNDSPAHRAALYLRKTADTVVGERVPSEDEIAEAKKAAIDAQFQAKPEDVPLRTVGKLPPGEIEALACHPLSARDVAEFVEEFEDHSDEDDEDDEESKVIAL